jgi:CDP-glucose 4,6-dehydratase
MAGVGLSEAAGLSPRGLVDRGFWSGRRVLVTGHTGFKGAWLSLWLQLLGAEVAGLSNGVPTTPSLYELARIGAGMSEEFVDDVRDFAALRAAIAHVEPEVVIHMAAQSLVRRSYADPRETFETNVMGTVNLFEAIRTSAAVRVVVNVTSDKCYENHERDAGYREDEAMGGVDPYSSSKGCAELVTASFRRAFFEVDSSAARLASARAGNVIGGGDWSEDRLLPDLMRAALGGEPLHVRNPDAVRPWQHVLNPLSGYLILAQGLWGTAEYATAWNFGPTDDDARPVADIVERVRSLWPGGLHWQTDEGVKPHEARSLRLDSTRARTRLGWRPVWGLDEALVRLVAWYQGYTAGADMRAVTAAEIDAFAGAFAGAFAEDQART